MTDPMTIVQAKRNFEVALQNLIAAHYNENHWLGDYIVSASVVNMNGPVEETHYLHDGKGAFHSQRGLVEEHADWLIELKAEENDDAATD